MPKISTTSLVINACKNVNQQDNGKSLTTLLSHILKLDMLTKGLNTLKLMESGAMGVSDILADELTEENFDKQVIDDIRARSGRAYIVLVEYVDSDKAIVVSW